MASKSNTGKYTLCAFEEDLVVGDTAIEDFEGAFRLIQFPNVQLLNNMQPAQGGARKLGNPRLVPIDCMTEAGQQIPLLFQCLVNGNNLGETTISSIISESSTVITEKELILTNSYITNMRILGGRDGLTCHFRIAFDEFSITHKVIDNEHTALGETAAGGSVDTQASAE